MRIRDGKIVFSPSDLNVFFESRFASWMDRLRREDPSAATPDSPPADLALAAALGEAHERAYLDSLVAGGRDVWTPPEGDDPFERHAAIRPFIPDTCHAGVPFLPKNVIVAPAISSQVIV